MNTPGPLTWDELRPLLDCSYRGGNGDETLSQFYQQRSITLGRLSKPPCLLPLAAHGLQASWAAALFTCCPDLSHKTTVSSDSRETVTFLAELLQTYAMSALPDAQHQKALLTLQKRFEVNRRLFDRYDQNMRRVSDNFMDLDPYALLALALQIMYLDSGCFSPLNTAVKLLDFIALSGWHGTRPYLLPLPFALEKAIFDELTA